jgi:hypothetical protein
MCRVHFQIGAADPAKIAQPFCSESLPNEDIECRRKGRDSYWRFRTRFERMRGKEL